MTVLNHKTGELVPIHPEEPGAIAMLNQAVLALTTALDQMPISDVANLKAKVATVATATKELGMSKEAQELAVEAVRRAEWALGRAIRKGQEEGTVSTKGSNSGLRGSVLSTEPEASPSDFASDLELYDRPSQGKAGILTIGEASPDEFDAAIEEAKAEGNLSRANVARKIKRNKPAEAKPSGRAAKADLLRELAAKGYTSHQMCKELDYARADQVRELAREYDIDIPADRVRGKAHRFNHQRVLDNVTEAVEVAAISLRDIDPAQLDKDEALERLDSLTASIRALSKATNRIKESFHE